MEDDDLISAIRGGTPKAPKAPSLAPGVDPVLATIYAESSADPSERKAVAAVIANRAKAGKLDPKAVVAQPGQFEAWTRPDAQARMAALTADSPEYKALQAQVQPVLAGQEPDPTNGATQYYAPGAQATLGRPPPAWDDGTGQKIGEQMFFGGQQALDPDIVGAIRGAPAQGKTPLAEPTPGFSTAAGPDQKTTTAAQDVAFTKLAQGKALDQNAPKGSAANPFAQVKEGDIPDSPGAYFIDLGGKLQRVPGGDTDALDVQKAVDAGDYMKAARLAKEAEQATGNAFLNHALSGALLGGKNEAGAILHHPLAFATEGGFDNPVIQNRITASDAADALQRAQHPYASDLGSVTGAVTGGGALSALTGGAADLPLLARLGFAGAEGAMVGGANSYLAADGGNAQRAAAGAEGAKVGALAGPAGEVAAGGGRYLANKVLGMGVSPEAARLAVAARDKYGIPLRGGQIADTPSTKFLDSVLQRTPFTGYAQNSAEQGAAFTRAVAKTMGTDADGLTPEVMQATRKRLGAEFDRVGGATTIKDTPQLTSDLDSVVAEAKKVLTDKAETPLEGQVKDIKSAFTKDASGNEVLTGEAYLNLTKRGTPLDRLTQSADPNVRHYAQQMKDTLLDAVARNATPEDLAALKLARTQYARMKTIEPLAEKAGPEGQISPALLMQAMRNNYDNLAYDGGGDLGELGKIGQRFLKEPPSSGTAERLRAMKLLEMGGVAAGGGGALWLYQHPEEAAKLGVGAGAVTLGTLAAGKLGAVMLDNPVYRNILTRSANGAPAIIRKGRPLLNAPSVVNSTTAPLLANRILGNQTSP